ncbi:MAG: CoA binding domain protein [Syntrophus sp. PtaB.Bin001]|nr:MAG: CoA binding domain protein [Syntrophus sp. PtaB.Bin001]
MHSFFNPKSIAVIGATPKTFKGGYAILKNLITTFNGRIYPINPQHTHIEGIPCFPTITDIPDAVDLAIIFIAASLVPEALEQCEAKGVQGVMIESGGFAEADEKGKSLQNAIKSFVQRTGIRVWGPNCMGLSDGIRGYIFSFTDPKLLPYCLVPGPVSLIVQSGMISAGFIIDILSNGVTGFSKVCSIGNKVDINESDVLSYLLEDQDTCCVGLYLESFVNGRRFVDICRNSNKPVVVLKGGRSRKGAEAAVSHTASLAGNYQVAAGALAQAGVYEARDFKQLVDFCRTLALYPPRPNNSKGRIAVVTFSGASGIVSADMMEEQGLTLAELSEATKTRLKGIFPSWMPVANPVDIWPAIEQHSGTDLDIYSLALEACLEDPEVDAVLLHTFSGYTKVKLDLQEYSRLSRSTGKPVLVWLLGNREKAFLAQKAARDCGVLVFPELSRAVECLSILFQRPGIMPKSEHRQPEFPDGPQDIPAEALDILEKGIGPLDEQASKSILKSFGIPTVEETLITDPHECKDNATHMGFPLVMKGVQPGIVHKTELGLIELNIDRPDAAMQSFERIMLKMNGRGSILMQKQLKGDVELILGAIRDPQFGPCVMIGIGGTLAGLIDDTVFTIAPFNKEEAVNAIGRLRTQEIINGFRGTKPVDRNVIASFMVTLGRMMIDYPRIREIDINPVIVSGNSAVAVDATIVLSDCQVQ